MWGQGHVGKISISYNLLKKKLGNPRRGGETGRYVEWELMFADGVLVTIYSPNKKFMAKNTKIWSLGGNNNKYSLERVKKMFPSAKITKISGLDYSGKY